MGNLGAGESAFSIGGLVGLLIHIGFVWAMVAWGRRIAIRRRSRAWRIASYVPIVGFVISMAGLVGTIVGLVSAFGAVSHTDPSQRAQRLADGIQIAMVWTAIGLGVGVLCYLGSVIAFLYGSYAALPPAVAVPPEMRDDP